MTGRSSRRPQAAGTTTRRAGDGPRRTAAGRVLAVLDSFGPERPALSLSEIARRADLTMPTAHRLVRELLGWGALERDARGRYSVGLRLLELSMLAPRGLELREVAFPFLDRVHRLTGGNVHLGVRDGTQVLYVEALRASGGNPLSSRIGDRWPMHASGTGLVLLAYADAGLQERVLDAPLERFTPMTVTDPVRLRRDLAWIRKTGAAVARGQITLPDLAVAVPVTGHDGDVAAAISVVLATERARPRELAALLTETARSISRRLAPHRRLRGAAARPAPLRR